MREVLDDINNWIKKGEVFAIATGMQTWGSSPRGIGSTMCIGSDMHIAGSVSGGCVENAVIEESAEVIKTGVPKILAYGVTDDEAWSVGLTCGGKIRVLLEKHIAFSDDSYDQKIWRALKDDLYADRPAILLTRFEPDNYSHLLIYPDSASVGNRELFKQIYIDLALDAYRDRRSREVVLEEAQIFIRVFTNLDRLIIIGAAHTAIFLIKFGHELGFRTLLIDPRRIFASPERFPVQPDEMITEWPDKAFNHIKLNEDTYAVLLTHEPKIDDMALRHLLKSPVSYIGALGSKKTHVKRCNRLRDAGFQKHEIDRIYGPVGLDINAESPSEIALSIMAEIIKIKRENKEI